MARNCHYGITDNDLVNLSEECIALKPKKTTESRWRVDDICIPAFYETGLILDNIHNLFFSRNIRMPRELTCPAGAASLYNPGLNTALLLTGIRIGVSVDDILN